MGIQTLESPVLETVRRAHGGSEALRAVRLLVERGLILNVDLMYGLPGQSMADFHRDVARLRAEGVHSLTLYDLRLSRTTPVARRLLRDEWLAFDRLMRWRAFVKATAEEFGYTQTRWHTFKRLDGPAARHERAPEHTRESLGYQLGIGMSARSHLGKTIYRNHRSFRTYVERIEAGESPVEDLYTLGDEDRRIIHVARSIGDGLPLDAAVYEAAFGTTIEEDYGEILARLTDAGALERTTAGYELTEAGKLLHDLVTLAFYPPRMQDWLRERQPPELVIGRAD
jgi:oxygen-independent coproporphyrinogen-3 oxidase